MKSILLTLLVFVSVGLCSEVYADNCRSVQQVQQHVAQVQRVRVVEHVQPVARVVEYAELVPVEHVPAPIQVQQVFVPQQVYVPQAVVIQEVEQVLVQRQVNNHCNQSVQRVRNGGRSRSLNIERSVQR